MTELFVAYALSIWAQWTFSKGFHRESSRHSQCPFVGACTDCGRFTLWKYLHRAPSRQYPSAKYLHSDRIRIFEEGGDGGGAAAAHASSLSVG